MDVFSTTVGALQVINILAKYISSVKDAPKDVRRLKEQIELVDRALSEAQSLYGKMTSEMKQSSKMREWETSLREKAEPYNSMIKDIQRNYQGDLSFKERLKYALDKKKLKESFDAIMWFHEVIGLFMQYVLVEIESTQTQISLDIRSELAEQGIMQQRTKSDIQSELATMRKMIQSEEADKRSDVVLHNLSNYSLEIHRRLSTELVNCRSSEPSWILNHSTLKKWLSTEPPQSSKRFLWGLGPAGAGKTCIASFVADQLREVDPTPQYDALFFAVAPSTNPEDSKNRVLKGPGRELSPPSGTAVAVFYCSYRDSGNHDVDFIFRCLCRQLIEHLHSINHWKARKHLQYAERMLEAGVSLKAPGNANAYGLLERLVQEFERSYIFVDALDEIQDPLVYHDLLGQLEKLTAVPTLRVFLTSRDGEEYYEAAARSQSATIAISPRSEHIQSYVESELDGVQTKSFRSVFAELIESEEIRASAVQKIVTASAGNYLCAQLLVRTLEGTKRKQDVQDTLNDLPRSLDQLLEFTIDRIKAQDMTLHQALGPVGEKTFMWAIFAEKDLTVQETSHAVLATLQGSDTLSIQAPSQQHLLESTCYFLSIDSNSTIKVHKALRDFCSRLGVLRRKEYFGEVQVEMVRACLHYLTRPNLQGPCGSKANWETRKKENPFFEYAVQFWGYHLKKCESDFLDKAPDCRLLLDVLQNDDIVASVSQAMQPRLQQDGLARYQDASPSYALPGEEWLKIEQNGYHIPALHLLAYFNLHQCCDFWLKETSEDVDSESSRGYSALWLSCQRGHKDLVRYLLRHGADPTRENSYRRYCLLVAASQGWQSIVDIILQIRKSRQVLIDQRDWLGRNVLHVAVVAGHLNIVQKLLSQGVSSALVDAERCNAYHLAAASGQQDMIDALIKYDHPKLGDASLVSLLDARNAASLTPLYAAWRYRKGGWKQIVERLSAAGAKPVPLVQTSFDDVQRIEAAYKPDWFRGTEEEYRVKRWLYPEGARDGDKVVIHRKKGQPLALEEGQILYVTSPPIPENARLPVFRVGIRIVSHDQGFSSQERNLDGTHYMSWTWFQLVRLSAQGEKLGPAIKLTTNVRARKELYEQRFEWDSELGGLSKFVQPERKHGFEYLSTETATGFVKSLQHDDRVGIEACAKFPAWKNCVYETEITIWYADT
ncbi:MAG: hypothetical protein Q9213_008175 [Squamulea squamosa]